MASSILGEAENRRTPRPRVQGLRNDEDLARQTTRYMVGTLEWTAPIFQGLVLFVSGIYDPYIRYGRAVVLSLAVAQFLIIPLYYRGFGPFTLGGRWTIICVAQCVLVNGILEIVAARGSYGNHILCVPGCNYSSTLWLFFAFYPWIPAAFARWRGPIEWCLLAAYYCYFLLLCWANNGTLTVLNLKTACISLLWLLIAYIFGKAIGTMCLAAAKKQLEVQERNYAEFFDFLHSHVKSSIAAIRLDLQDPRRAGEKLDEMEETISGYRMDLLLAQDRVPLAALFSERIRTFTGILDITETPRIGALTVTRPIGILIARALGDLLKNAAKYGATSVQIKCRITENKIIMDISDNGPGFPAEILDDNARSLNRLRHAARVLGGDLTMHSQDGDSGAVLTLTAPIRGSEVRK